MCSSIALGDSLSVSKSFLAASVADVSALVGRFARAVHIWQIFAAADCAAGSDLDYWSNRINDWADIPSVSGSINAGFLASEASRYKAGQTLLVDEGISTGATRVMLDSSKSGENKMPVDFGEDSHSDLRGFGNRPHVPKQKDGTGNT